MKVVWKFPLTVNSVQVLSLPEGAIPLHVNAQDNEPFLWCLCDSSQPVYADREFRFVTTGETFSNTYLQYIGTVHLDNGHFVAHVFEVKGSQS